MSAIIFGDGEAEFVHVETAGEVFLTGLVGSIHRLTAISTGHL